ncbi:isoprenylcysteine carboxyl methyltransferase family protein [Streptomyces wuyuanensis]|uniref:isoprenylcysteine carboxyl methyltransferase family protein n=1 Tax=Streptomyces wuyuanensis TaxID=1196353 RepID=UPI003D7459C7
MNAHTSTAFLGLVLLVAVERLAELEVARRNTAWSRAHGGVEHGRGHYPVMVVLHTALLAGCAVEPWAADRPFVPALGWTMLALTAAAQALRWWCIVTLGPRWNTRVVVVPGLPLVAAGPYRWLRHPNYAAVVVEGFALPLVYSAWVTALTFTALNLVLLGVRIRCEESALTVGAGSAGRPANAVR